MNGIRLTFHLAGINNQNFIMRDEETGTYWQQINGRAISGPLAGRSLPAIPFDEMTLALWRKEQPAGTILKDVPKDVSGYAAKDWDVKMQKAPTVLNFAGDGLSNRDVMLGLDVSGAARAYRFAQVLQEKLVVDRVGSEAVILLVGPDGQSVRAFRGTTGAFYRTADGGMMDSATGSIWNFGGCAVEGKLKGSCLGRLPVLKDYWFDWRNYHPATTVYKGAGRVDRK